MSLQTWMDLYYPTPAEEFEPDYEQDIDPPPPTPEVRLAAVEHCLRKWVGLRPAALDEHDVERDGPMLLDSEEHFDIDAGSCALCALHEDGTGCEHCVLAQARGGTPCAGYGDCDRDRGDDRGPYHEFTRFGNPEPMIFWLTKARDLLIERDLGSLKEEEE